jgi:hypothetical protein
LSLFTKPTRGITLEVVELADLNDLEVELDIVQDNFAKLSPVGRISRPQV